MTHDTITTNDTTRDALSTRSPLISCLATVALLASSALAQLTPDRTFYGVDRKIPMTVAAPAGDAEIKLMNPTDGTEIAGAPAVDGGVDLASLFPTIWADKSQDVMYAQLLVDGTLVGSPVVLTPMISVDKATNVDPQTMQPAQPGQRNAVPKFESDFYALRGQARNVVYSGLRAYPLKDVVLETSMGDIRIRLRPDMAPNHALNFATLVDGGFYTDVIFHRIMGNFVIQVGDPTGTGSGGPGFQIDLEKSPLPHDFGVLSMARTGDPDTGGSQIFICLSRKGTAMLDNRYTGFGQAIAGADTIAALGSVEVGGPRNDRPIDPPLLKRAYLVDAAPFGTGPAPVAAPVTTEADAPEGDDR
jgi:cyclophilin family peptidyl-prolyl cis-trans isomerase